MGSLPNVYLVHAGTNNLYTTSQEFCASAGSGSSSDACQAAANALSDLLNTLYYTGALLVVAQITPSLNSSYNSRIGVYNQLVANLVNSKKQSDGWRVQLVNMQSQVTTNDIKDNCDGTGSGNIVHPNDGGYQKMSSVWYNGLVNASNAGLIPDPRTPYGYAQTSCGSIDANKSWCGNVNVYSGRGQANFFYGVQCKDVSSDASICNCNDGGSSNFNVTKTGSCAEMSIGYTTATRWADLNGDGRQEVTYITASGGLNKTLNRGIGTWPNSYGCFGITSNFTELGVSAIAPPGTKRYQVQLADLNGDARAEFIVIASNGSATGYYNTGSPHTLDNNIGINFASTAAQVAPSFGVSGIGVRFADFNGDGRADYLWVSANGALNVWLNNNTANTANVGNNWVSQGSVGPAVPSGTTRENVIMADINADGRSDYLIVNRTDGSVSGYLNKPPASGSNTPQWTSLMPFVSSQVGQASGATQFLADVIFADPDGNGHYDFLVVNGGDSSIMGQENICY